MKVVSDFGVLLRLALIAELIGKSSDFYSDQRYLQLGKETSDIQFPEQHNLIAIVNTVMFSSHIIIILIINSIWFN